MMNQNRPLILVSNDDGFDSNGIRSLVSFIADLGDVLVCAPDELSALLTSDAVYASEDVTVCSPFISLLISG